MPIWAFATAVYRSVTHIHLTAAIIEFVQGWRGNTARREALLYGLDAWPWEKRFCLPGRLLRNARLSGEVEDEDEDVAKAWLWEVSRLYWRESI